MRSLRRGFGSHCSGHRGFEGLSDLGVRVLLREVPGREAFRVGSTRIEALLEKQTDQIDLEGEIDRGERLAVPHCAMQRGVSFGIDELEQSVRRTRIDVALAGLDVQTVDRVEERLPLKKWKRGNRFAELCELAGGTVFEEVEAETDRRFARLVRREGRETTRERTFRLPPWESSVEKRSQSRRRAAQCSGVRPKLSG